MEGEAPKGGQWTAAMPQDSYTDLEEKLARAQRERDEALEQQMATSEILRTVAHSSADIQSVLDAVCQSAARLCEAYNSAIWRPDGDRLLLVAHHGPITQVENSSADPRLSRGPIGSR